MSDRITKRILLIDDSEDDILLTLRSFKKNNILVDIDLARNGVEALEYLFGKGEDREEQRRELPALILLDIKLPRLNGLEVLAEIRKNPKTKLIPVVILTTSKEESDMIRSYHLGVNSYVRKPVNFDEFTEVVKQLGLYWLLLNQSTSEE